MTVTFFVLAVSACASTDKASRRMLDLNHEALSAYEANAQIIAIAGQMFDALINAVRR